MVQEHTTYRVNIILSTVAVIITLVLGTFVRLFILKHKWWKTNDNEGALQKSGENNKPEENNKDDGIFLSRLRNFNNTE